MLHNAFLYQEGMGFSLQLVIKEFQLVRDVEGQSKRQKNDHQHENVEPFVGTCQRVDDGVVVSSFDL